MSDLETVVPGRGTPEPGKMVCANNADADDLYQAAELLRDRAPGLADRLYNSAFAVAYRRKQAAASVPSRDAAEGGR